MAMVLKPEQIIHLVSTIIATETYPLNMGAIKMLHKVVEHWGREAIEPHLAKVMPGLIKVREVNKIFLKICTSRYVITLYNTVRIVLFPVGLRWRRERRSQERGLLHGGDSRRGRRGGAEAALEFPVLQQAQVAKHLYTTRATSKQPTRESTQ